MSDLISRQAAIDAIMGEPTDAHYPSWYAERLEQLPFAQPEQRWISFKIRPFNPVEGGDFLMDDIRERMCNNYCGFGVKFGAGKDIACKHCPLNELPKWIPVAERLPEMGSTVLMQNTGGWMFVATYVVTPKRKYWAMLEHDCALDEAIAWMPLPERFAGR